LAKTVVATCDQEILEYIESIGGQAIMTGNHHERASDRCAEALSYLEEQDGMQYDIIVMVQGDEPMTHPDMITEAVDPMIKDQSILITNLQGDISSMEEFEDRNCIKVVCDLNSNALYFSREAIPTKSKIDKIPIKK
jgi:3-deoxy-manno-octulosonate cytidylyltransferase (CMP-KDO synthetase)